MQYKFERTPRGPSIQSGPKKNVQVYTKQTKTQQFLPVQEYSLKRNQHTRTGSMFCPKPTNFLIDPDAVLLYCANGTGVSVGCSILHKYASYEYTNYIEYHERVYGFCWFFFFFLYIVRNDLIFHFSLLLNVRVDLRRTNN